MAELSHRLLSSPQAPTISRRLLESLMSGVRRTGQGSAQTQAQAVWNVANVLEVPAIAGSPLLADFQEELVEVALELASARGAVRSVEMVIARPFSRMSLVCEADISCLRASLDTQSRISSIRILGVLLSRRPSMLTAVQEERAMSILVQCLQLPSPKTQWNAATAIKGFLAGSALPTVSAHLLVGVLLDVLRSDKNIKVRLSALTALREARVPLDSNSNLQEELVAAIESIEALKDSLPFDEAVRADQLISAVRIALGSLARNDSRARPGISSNACALPCHFCSACADTILFGAHRYPTGTDGQPHLNSTSTGL